MKFEQEELGYDFDSLEPYIDKETMEIHYGKHHKAYTEKFNKSAEELVGEAEDIVAKWKDAPEEVRDSVRNNGGGYINHNLFWKVLKKDVAFQGDVAEAIKKKFGSFEDFKDKFSDAAKSRFGSGWAWLVVDTDGELEITSTPNQDTPLSQNKKPILLIDVWEHAYYLKYQNRRPEYIDNFFNVVNWQKVDELYKEALN